MLRLCLAAALATQPVIVAQTAAGRIATADQLAGALASADLPVTDVQVVTPKSDPNKLMGRPGQYTSKVFFTDMRYSHGEYETSAGENTIEGFASIADAKRRADYVSKMARSSPMFAQYVYHRGTFVLRLDRALDPEEAAAYDAALAKIISQKL